MDAARGFVQIIDFETERIDDLRALFEDAQQRFQSREYGPTRRLMLRDRKNPNRYLGVLEFSSYEDAMRNSNDPETTKLAERVAALCTRLPSFTDCDVEEMNDLA